MAPSMLAEWKPQWKPNEPAAAKVNVAVVPMLVAMMGLPIPSGVSGWLAKAPFQVTLAPWWIFTQLGEYCAGATSIGKVMVTSPSVTVTAAGSHPFTRVLVMPDVVL